MQSVIYMRAKFEVSSSNRSRDMEGSQNFKSRSRDPFPTPFDLFFLFLSFMYPVVNLHAKFEVSRSNLFRDIKGVPKFKKSRSRDDFPTPFHLIFQFYRY